MAGRRGVAEGVISPKTRTSETEMRIAANSGTSLSRNMGIAWNSGWEACL